jgi:NAD(P)-dependent dehydrogenase (short-subunit alcohol dehydrogenase family)
MRSVLITGTSTGIGQATAVTLAARGWRVFATMRNLEKRGLLEQALKEAGVRDGVEIEQLDVNDAASIRTAVASMLSQTGNKLDAVVHNAGVAAAGALEDVPESELRRVMETNFFGVLELTRALLPTFRAQRRGRIVIVSSEAAEHVRIHKVPRNAPDEVVVDQGVPYGLYGPPCSSSSPRRKEGGTVVQLIARSPVATRPFGTRIRCPGWRKPPIRATTRGAIESRSLGSHLLGIKRPLPPVNRHVAH